MSENSETKIISEENSATQTDAETVSSTPVELNSPTSAAEDCQPTDADCRSRDELETEASPQPEDNITAKPDAAENSDLNPADCETINTEPEDRKFDPAEALMRIDDIEKKLKSALEDGQLKECISLYEQCQARLRKFQESDHKHYKVGKRKKIQKKLNTIYIEIQNLKKWRHWGMNQARQELIAELHTLKESKQHPKDLYSKLKSIRDQWHKWNKTGDFPNQQLREGFSKAYDAAFEPCKIYFSEQKKLRKQNKKQRKEICIELETLFESTDWRHNPDWQLIWDAIRTARKKWQSAVPLNKKDWESTNARFDEVMEKFKPHLERERDKGVAFRKELIRKANALDSESVKDAMTKAKSLQLQWKTVFIRSQKRKENELWEEFKDACDRQFERRLKLQQEKNRQREENRHLRRKLLKEIKTINQLQPEEIKATALTVANIQERWKKTTSHDRHVTDTLETEFNDEISKTRKLVRQAEKLETESLFLLLERKAEICELVEQALQANDADSVLAENKRKWSSIADSCGDCESTIQERFSAACHMLESGSSADARQIAENYEAKQDICLRLEVLTDLESPPEYARQRMQYNVERLNAAMTKRSEHSNPEQEINELMVQYWLTGAVPSEHHESIGRRFHRIRSMLQNTVRLKR